MGLPRAIATCGRRRRCPGEAGQEADREVHVRSRLHQPHETPNNLLEHLDRGRRRALRGQQHQMFCRPWVHGRVHRPRILHVVQGEERLSVGRLMQLQPLVFSITLHLHTDEDARIFLLGDLVFSAEGILELLNSSHIAHHERVINMRA